MKKILLLCASLFLNYSQASIIFFDDSVSVDPLAWQTDWTGYAINPITIFGSQTAIKIVDQVVDSYSPTTGVLANTDTIAEMFSKVGGTLPTNYTTLGITSGSPSSTQLTAFQRYIVIDGSVTGKTIILPDVAASGVIPGTEYIFSLGGGLVTSNTVAVPSGNYMNDTLNGTYTIAALLSGRTSIRFAVHNNRWYANP